MSSRYYDVRQLRRCEDVSKRPEHNGCDIHWHTDFSCCIRNRLLYSRYLGGLLILGSIDIIDLGLTDKNRNHDVDVEKKMCEFLVHRMQNTEPPQIVCIIL